MNVAKTVSDLRLSVSYVDAKPTSYDYSNKYDAEETGEGWRSYDAVKCEACGMVVVCSGGTEGEQHRYVNAECDCGGDDECKRCEGSEVVTCTGELYASEPAMSYFYPCDWSSTDDAKAISHLPLCLVEVDGEKGIALTGGGMDLSWEISEAYVALGYYPPVHFTLPKMADRWSEGKQKTAEAMITAIEIFRGWLARRSVETSEALAFLKR